MEQNQCNQYPPFPDNRTRADYDLTGNEQQMASLVVVAWGARLNILYSLVCAHAGNPNRSEVESAELKKHCEGLDFALQAMEQWKKYRSGL